MNKSESIANLALALAKAQGELSNPKKNSANPFFKSRYSDLSEVINVSKSVLSEHGLSIVQLASYSDSMAHVETIILHATGEYISETLSMPVVKHDAQSIGSVVTYARRYSWAAICGLAQEDDDGNVAVGREVKQQHTRNDNHPIVIMINKCTTVDALKDVCATASEEISHQKYFTEAKATKYRELTQNKAA
jgi:hypothetical protein